MYCTTCAFLVDLEEFPEESENLVDKLHKAVILMTDTTVSLFISLLTVTTLSGTFTVSVVIVTECWYCVLII